MKRVKNAVMLTIVIYSLSLIYTTIAKYQNLLDQEREIYERPTKEKLENMKYFKETGTLRFKDKNYS